MPHNLIKVITRIMKFTNSAHSPIAFRALCFLSGALWVQYSELDISSRSPAINQIKMATMSTQADSECTHFSRTVSETTEAPDRLSP